MDNAGARVAIQGFGAVGQAAADRLVELGAVVTAVATSDGAVIDPDGLDVAGWLRSAPNTATAASARTAKRSTRPSR